MANVRLVCKGVSWSYLTFFADSGLTFDASIGTGDKVLTSITLYCTKFTNPNFGIDTGHDVVPAGTTTSNATVTLQLQVNNVWSDVKTITGKKALVKVSGAGDPVSRFECYVNTEDSYVFSFPTPVPVNQNTVIRLKVTGVASYSTGLSIRRNSDDKQGFAVIEDANRDPDSVNVDNSSGDNGWITDRSGTLENASQGVLRDYTTKYKYSVSPSNADVTSVTISGNDYVNYSVNTGDREVTITAKNSNTEYPTTDTLTLTVNGGASAQIPVNFYEKVKTKLSGNDTLDLNVRDAYEKYFSITGYKSRLENSHVTGQRLFFRRTNGNYTDKGNFTTNGQTLPIGDFLTMQSDSANMFKYADEGIWHNLLYRFYNTQVQTANCTQNDGSYKQDIVTKVRWSITPDNINQFSFDWLDINNNVIPDSEVPELILIGQDAPIIGNLTYSNAAVTSGFCRGFRVEYLDGNNIVRTNYFNADFGKTGPSTQSGRILNSGNLTGIPKGKEITIRITMYFYYDVDSGDYDKYKYGAQYTLKQKLLYVDDSDLYPQLLFPICSKTTPYTKMMLEDVERFGYIIPDLIIGTNAIFSESRLIILVNGKELTIESTPEYFSSNKLTKNIVVDIGKYVKDSKLYVTQLRIQPCIDLYYKHTYIKRIEIEGNDTTLPKVIINTSESTHWLRPVVEQGVYATYFDYDRFMEFINKYRPLVDNQMFNVPTDKRGDIINTDFWVNIANRLDDYAENMQDWATDATNTIVLWALPKFKHKKGEMITNNNLYQNYYDLLVQHSSYDSFATHDFLNENKFTHNTLHNYTHNQITNKEM